jgi:hypothetical protein
MHFSSHAVPWTNLVPTSATGLGVGIRAGLSASSVKNVLVTGIVALARGTASALCVTRAKTVQHKTEKGWRTSRSSLGKTSVDTSKE